MFQFVNMMSWKRLLTTLKPKTRKFQNPYYTRSQNHRSPHKRALKRISSNMPTLTKGQPKQPRHTQLDDHLSLCNAIVSAIIHPNNLEIIVLNYIVCIPLFKLVAFSLMGCFLLHVRPESSPREHFRNSSRRMQSKSVKAGRKMEKSFTLFVPETITPVLMDSGILVGNISSGDDIAIID